MTEILDGVWHTLTGETPGPVELTGAEDVLPGPYRVAAAATASVAAATLAAGELLKLREIDPGVVTADTRHAAAAFASEAFSRVEGAEPESVWAPLSGNYRTTDGWVRLHCNYPRHEAAVCWGLGVPGSRDVVTKTVAGRIAREVEHAVVSAGGAAASCARPKTGPRTRRAKRWLRCRWWTWRRSAKRRSGRCSTRTVRWAASACWS